MLDNTGEKLIDRRFLLSAAVGGSTAALLGFLVWPKSDDVSSSAVLKYLRTELGNDPELSGFALAASDSLAKSGENWSDSLLSANGLVNFSVGEIKNQVKDDFRNGRTVVVFDWVMSRTEALLLTLI